MSDDTTRGENSSIGSSLGDFLIEEGIYEESCAVAEKRVIAWQIEQGGAKAMTAEIVTLESSEEELGTSGGIPGEVEALLILHLAQYVYAKRLGRVFGSQTDFELKGIGRRQPDLAFVKLERLPINVRDAVPMAPDLAVEVVSKTDHTYDVEDKVQEYLRAGVGLVWVVRPIGKIVEVYRPGQEVPTLLGLKNELDGEDVIPGFKLKVSAIFDYPPNEGIMIVE
ncbi:MAG: Uma2 family endonuclease [Chloroflexota bacterium]